MLQMTFFESIDYSIMVKKTFHPKYHYFEGTGIIHFIGWKNASLVSVMEASVEFYIYLFLQSKSCEQYFSSWCGLTNNFKSSYCPQLIKSVLLFIGLCLILRFFNLTMTMLRWLGDYIPTGCGYMKFQHSLNKHLKRSLNPSHLEICKIVNAGFSWNWTLRTVMLGRRREAKKRQSKMHREDAPWN